MAKVTRLFKGRAARDRRFTELVRPHLSVMYRMAYRWAQNPEDAEDLVQETLIRVVDRVDEMEQLDQLRSWLIKILYRSFVDLHRKHSRSPTQQASEWTADMDVLEEDGRSDDSDASQLDSRRDLLKALETLNDDQRDVIFLHDTEGYSATEVASILDISPGTVKSRLHRARTYLKHFLK